MRKSYVNEINESIPQNNFKFRRRQHFIKFMGEN